MILLSALLLLVAPQTAPAVPERGPVEAVVAGVERVCPLYMKSEGLTEADEAVLASEMQMRAGPIGIVHQTASNQIIRLEGYPGFCMVLAGEQAGRSISDEEAAILLGGLNAWIAAPASGWTPSPTEEQPGRYLSTDRERALLLIDQPDDGGVMIVLQPANAAGQSEADARIGARRQATERPTDQAVLDAVDTVCAIAGTAAWFTIDRGEVMVRHSGNSRLTVDYNSNADCTIRVVGEDTAAVATALGQRLEAPDSEWTRTTHAWMTFSNGGPMGREMQGNYRHDDGREFSIMLDAGEAQVILWQPLRTEQP